MRGFLRSGLSACALIATAVAAFPGMSAPAPAQFAICAACHKTTPDNAQGVGPNLRGVVGRKAGTSAGFAYSPAMKASPQVWTKERLDAYLANPQAVVPRNRMPFAGMKNASDRAAVITYLTTLK